ncbi:MAG: PQQ-binding-like beta-propeller repeat protein [Gemmataceae bacterium]
MLTRCTYGFALVLLAGWAAVASAAEANQAKPFDWPQWQGIDRTAISKETGLLPSWPAGGPPLVWVAKGLGGGFSTPSVAAGRIFGMSFRGDDEVVWALDEQTGKELWATRIAATRRVGHGSGSRSTPTVDGELLYGVGVSGDLVCLEVATGNIVWQKNMPKEFGGRMMSGWGYSESPLIDGDKVIATPGGKEATLVALHKKTGDLIWQCPVPGGDGAGYSSVAVTTVNGQRQYVQFLGRGVVGVAADDGKFLWRYDRPANGTANCSTPVCLEDYVFAASAYGTGGGLVKITPKGQENSAEEVYFTKSMKNHHGGMVLLDGYLYGANESILTCLDYKTGQIMWETRAAGKGSIAYADGRLYFRNERGPLLLIDANPKEYVERGRFDQPERSNLQAWPHPVIANGKLYIRDQDVLLCFDVKQK